jgi:hypothetical protein
MRVSAVMIVLNGMPWLPYLLRNLYPHVDEWVIVEGAQAHIRSVADEQGHSLDDTVQVIKNFPDPARKIRLIQQDRHWVDRDEMFAVGTAQLHGDYLWQIDVDEFYRHEDILRLKTFMAAHPHIEAYSFLYRDFFGGFRGYVQGGEYYPIGYQHWRLWRWRKGYQYVRHEPPLVLDGAGTDVRWHGYMEGQDLYRQLGLLCYHYSYVLPEQVRRKAISESERSIYPKNAFFLGRSQASIRQWYEEHYLRFTPWEVNIKPLPSWIEPYDGPHPAEIDHLRAEIATGQLAVALRQGDDIERFLDSPWRWRLWRAIGLLRLGYLHRIKPLLRPFVRLVRQTFLGYDYREERRKEALQRQIAQQPWHQ